MLPCCGSQVLQGVCRCAARTADSKGWDLGRCLVCHLVLQVDDVPGALVLQALQAHSRLVLNCVDFFGAYQAWVEGSRANTGSHLQVSALDAGESSSLIHAVHGCVLAQGLCACTDSQGRQQRMLQVPARNAQLRT